MCVWLFSERQGLHTWGHKQTTSSPALHLAKTTAQQAVSFSRGPGQGDIWIKWWGLENADLQVNVDLHLDQVSGRGRIKPSEPFLNRTVFADFKLKAEVNSTWITEH